MSGPVEGNAPSVAVAPVAPGHGVVPRCRRCGYFLRGLPAGSCPECARPFDPGDPRTITFRPPFVWWRFWLPGLVLAFVLGVSASATLIWMGSLGMALVYGVPVAIGTVLGYTVRARYVVLPILAIVVVLAVAMALISMNITGLYCGLMLGVGLFGPAVFGLLCGVVLRSILKRTRFQQRAYLPMLLAAVFPLGIAAIEGVTPEGAPVSVSTTETLDASAVEVWATLMLYEEVRSRPPLLLSLGLPRPLRTSGSMEQRGDVKVCVYDKGRLVKRMIEVVPHDRLVFVVTEQRIGFERSVRLRSGSFVLDERPDGRTDVILTTEYAPLLRPRHFWGWSERLGVRTLHRHVLGGMAAELDARRSMPSLASISCSPTPYEDR